MIRIDFGRILDRYTCIDYGSKITDLPFEYGFTTE